MRNDKMPVLKLSCDRLGRFMALGGGGSHGVNLGLQVVLGIVRVFKEVDDVSDASFLGGQRSCSGTDGGHAMLGLKEGLAADVTAVL